MAWVYLLDAHCVIFYRLPPQFRLFEAVFGQPTQDAVFDAINQLKPVLQVGMEHLKLHN